MTSSSLCATLLKPSLDIRTHLEECTREDVKRDRQQKGLCPTCGYQIYKKVAMGLKRKPRTVPGRVLNGRCLLCDPDEDTMRSISSVSSISATDETSFLGGKNLAPLDVARMRSINMDLLRMGGKYSEYGFGFAVSVPCHDNSGESNNNNNNNNLSHVYPVPKSKKKSLFTLRPENFEQRFALISSRDLAMVVGNEFPSASRIERPVALADTLKNIQSYARMSNLGDWSDLSSALDDEQVCVRFQTTFLPVDKKNKNRTIEFAMESQSGFTGSNEDDDEDDSAHTSDMMFLCTNQGTSVTRAEGKHRKQKFFHHVRCVDDRTSCTYKHWLEGEWANGKKRKSEQKIPEQQGIQAIGMRFNVIMTIQVPLSKEVVSETESEESSEEEMLIDDRERQSGESSSTNDEEAENDWSTSEESENGWSSGAEDTYTDDSIDEDSEIWSEYDSHPSTALEQAMNKRDPVDTQKNDSPKASGGMVMNLHTMVTSGMISSTEEFDRKDNSRPEKKVSKQNSQPLTPDTSHEESGEDSNGSAEEGEPTRDTQDEDEESVLVFGVAPKARPKKKKSLPRLGRTMPAFQNLSGRFKALLEDKKMPSDAAEGESGGSSLKQLDQDAITKLLDYCPEKPGKGKLKKGTMQPARLSVGTSKGKKKSSESSKSGRRHDSRINVTFTIIHGVVGGVPNKQGVKAAVDEMEDLYRGCEGGTAGP